LNTTRRLRAAWLVFALAASAAIALPELPGGTAHWKSIVEIEGGTREGMGPIDSEIWLKAGRMRMQMRVLGMTQNVIRIGDTTYQWIEGQKSGVKLAGNPEDRASGIYANRIDEYRTKGKKTGSETIDGHACDIYELTTTAKDGRVRKEKGEESLADAVRNVSERIAMKEQLAALPSPARPPPPDAEDAVYEPVPTNRRGEPT
jgi:hypothetical protein